MIKICNDNDKGGEQLLAGSVARPRVLTSTERRVQSIYLLLGISSCGDVVTVTHL
jgi:hypothetical protein